MTAFGQEKTGKRKSKDKKIERKQCIKKVKDFKDPIQIFTHFRHVSQDLDFTPVRAIDILIGTRVLICKTLNSVTPVRRKERNENTATKENQKNLGQFYPYLAHNRDSNFAPVTKINVLFETIVLIYHALNSAAQQRRRNLNNHHHKKFEAQV